VGSLWRSIAAPSTSRPARFLTTDVTLPEVTSFTPVVKHGRITASRLTFSTAMAADLARRTPSYLLIWAGRDGKLGTRDDKVIWLRSTTYRAARHEVVLKPWSGLSPRRRYQLSAYGAELSDPAGSLLAGEDGVAGTNYVVTFGGKSRGL
jgi:hypothetical protein